MEPLPPQCGSFLFRVASRRQMTRTKCNVKKMCFWSSKIGLIFFKTAVFVGKGLMQAMTRPFFFLILLRIVFEFATMTL